MSDQLQFGEQHNVTPCQRCSMPLRVGRPPSTEAQLLRRSSTGVGVCPTCAVRKWLEAFMGDAHPNLKPEHLLLPHVREQFIVIMRVGNADAKPDEINWQKLVDEWDLPIPGARKARR